MEGASKTCSKCSGKMEEGFSLERAHGGFVALRWLQGRPEPSFWQGTKTKGKDCRAIVTYRCTRCGYLESYANEVVELSIWQQ
jgi:hypothetical protein